MSLLLLYAEFEMSHDNHFRARSIFYLGAQSLSESSHGATRRSSEFAKLYHSWAVCEWHLNNLDRAEVLFDHALRLTDSGDDGSDIRSLILSSIARFLFFARADNILAQHCVCLSLEENRKNLKSWLLWSEIASAMDNRKLCQECVNQAEKLCQSDSNGMCESTIFPLNEAEYQKMLRRAPWHSEISSSTKTERKSWYQTLTFPDSFCTNEKYQHT